jgi:hypothetical protein
MVCDACSTCYPGEGCVGTPHALGSDPGQCNRPVAASTLKVTSRSTPAKNHLAAKLVTSAAGPGSFGDPTTSTDYHLCVFQTEGSRDLALWTAPAGGGWRPDSSGFSYKLLDATGLNQLKLKLSPGGNVATVVVKARGAAAGIAHPGFVGVAPSRSSCVAAMASAGAPRSPPRIRRSTAGRCAPGPSRSGGFSPEVTRPPSRGLPRRGRRVIRR